MSIIIEVAKELLGMFLADARLTAATLVLVAVVAGVVLAMPAHALWGGGLLLAGALAILIGVTVREARSRGISG